MKNLINSSLNEKILFFFIVTFLLCSCSGRKEAKTPILKTGESYLEVPGGKIWYKITGTGQGTPVVLIHGGPGGSSGYLKVFEELGNDRQVIRYDQLGCGKSDLFTDTTMFTVDHFVEELDSLRTHLGLPVWNVFGHSWGTIIAIEYYHRYPNNVSSLILGSLCFDIPTWVKSTNQRLLTFPDSLQEGIQKAEETGNYNDLLYQEAMNQFYSKFVWGPNPPQDEFDTLMSKFNTFLYGYMWGSSEFTVTGTLEGYDASYILPEIKVPTLLTAGEFDEILPEVVKEKAALVKDSRTVIFAGSSHMTPWDARDENLRVVRDFLNSVDSLNKE
jgi:proline iminopeptidase